MKAQATVMPLTPQKRLIRHCAVIILSSLLLGACGAIDYDIHEKNFFASSKKNKNIGTITFHYGEGEDYEMRVRRVKGGYAFQAPVFEDEDGSYTRFTASRTKDKKYFVGVEGRILF